ncbi:MAG: sensor histidine kinase [Planctomycetota bacterium]
MTTTDVRDITSQLSELTENLRASYAKLERRAERVERDLVVANLELARRIEEVESLRAEERRLEAKLASSAKLAALGTMAAGIAHEVRNPMNAVRGFAELLRDDLEPGLRAHRFATRICEGVDEIDGIVRSLLGLAADDRLVREEIDPAELARQAISAARSEACSPPKAERWTIHTRIECPAFRADAVKLRQALKNLVANAVQAQPSGGAVAVEIRDADGWVEFRVHDAGPGLAESLRGRAGEPFLTTRAEGTGLGLALVHAIAAVHGGSFEIGPDPGPLGGADARLRIPHQHS